MQPIVNTETASHSRPAPSVMSGVIPYVAMRGRAGEAADFYARAFGAVDVRRMPDADDPERYIHLEVAVNGGALMMSDMSDPSAGAPPAPQGFHLQLVVADGDFWWIRAVEAGCAVVMPFERMFWGDRWGMLRDPFGLTWAVNEPAEA